MPVEANELYAGDHWCISSELPGLARRGGFVPKLWIVSAGYGLIRASDRLQPYAAAFSPGHPDCVVHPNHPNGTIEGFKEWWEGMAAWEGPVPRQPRTIAELARRNPKSTFLVVASELYLKAIWSDLVEAGRTLVGNGRLMLVSAGMKEFGPLANSAVPVDARMQARLGGARRSLNVRMAKRLLTWLTPDTLTSSVRERCILDMHGLKSVATECREKCSDAEVMKFIRAELDGKRPVSATLLLKRLRVERQRACEQKRFSKLFQQVRESEVA